MLRNVQVQPAIRGQMGIGQMGGKLKKYLRVAEQVSHYATDPSLQLSAVRESRDTIMDYARLTGQLVEKRQVESVAPEQQAAIALLVMQLFNQQTPSLRMPHTDAETVTPPLLPPTLASSAASSDDESTRLPLSQDGARAA